MGIHTKMRITYWSHSKFADKLRKVFGLPAMIPWGTGEEWDDFYKLEKSKSSFGVKVIDSLNTLQDIVHYPKDKFYALIYYITNIKNGSHVLKTQSKLGQWSDLSGRIPDALMLSIIEFVREECFSKTFHWRSNPDPDWEYELVELWNQSYLARKLFPVYISDRLKEKYGLEYLQFQIEFCREDNKSSKITIAYEEIIAAYKFAATKYFTFDAYEESGYHKLPKGYGGFMSATDELKLCFKVIHKLEEEFEKEVELHCVNLVRHRKYLWT